MRYSTILILAVSLHFTVAGNCTGTFDPDSSHYLDLPTGSRIFFYFCKGIEPRKPYPIIYLHGGPGGFVSAKERTVISKLADDGYDVLLYDQVGSGKSERLKKIREYTIKRHLKDLEAIIDWLNVEKVIFIGHSWGGSLAPLYLAKHPDKVEKIVLSGPGGMIPKNFNILTPRPDSIHLLAPEGIKYHLTDYLSPAEYKRYNTINNFASIGIRIAPDCEIDSLLDHLMRNKTLLKYKDRMLPDSSLLEAGSGGYSHIRTGMFISKGKDQRPFLSTLTTPVLLLLGEEDPIQWACIADYLTTFKNIRLKIIPASGHSVFTFQPELCLKITREFLDQ